MATERFPTDMRLYLRCQWQDRPPQIQIRLDDRVLYSGEIEEDRIFGFSEHLDVGTHVLEVELHSKPDHDPCQSLSIQGIEIAGIRSEKFVWQGVYRPRYPEPWASQQRAQGQVLAEELDNTGHLGWNGIWCLEFTVPIFTWIHQVENLGWIYD